MRVIATLRSLLPTLATGALLVSSPVSAQSTVDFSTLGYGGATSACNWGGGSEIGATYPSSGFQWYGLKALDLANYQKCWTDYKPSQDNGYQETGVVALGTGTAQVQSSDFTPFQLTSLTVGSGWVNGITLTFKGYLASWTETPVERSIQLDASTGLGATNPATVWNLGIGPIRFFTLDVNWGLGAMPIWDGIGTPPTWSGDPFNSRELQRDYERDVQQSLSGTPYQTYFVSSMTVAPPATVPEPGTWALMVTGLAGVAFTARRRRTS